MPIANFQAHRREACRPHYLLFLEKVLGSEENATLCCARPRTGARRIIAKMLRCEVMITRKHHRLPPSLTPGQIYFAFKTSLLPLACFYILPRAARTKNHHLNHVISGSSLFLSLPPNMRKIWWDASQLSTRKIIFTRGGECLQRARLAN